jgi:adenosine deaminase
MNTQPDDRVEQFIREIPKVELHIHLEGAIPLDTLLGLIRRKGTEPAIISVDDLRRKLTYVDFESFIDLWTWKNTFIETEHDFEQIAYDVLRDLDRQNVKYVELTYSPGDYWKQGLSVQKITECIIQGKHKAADDFGIRCELILDLIRDHGPEAGMERLDQLGSYLGKGLVGIGLGGREQEFPPEPYEAVYKEARRRGFRLTAHAGEAAGADSVWGAIDRLGVERVGHGTRAYEDLDLLSQLKDRRIPLEMCVISNVRTRVCESIETHPIRRYYDEGLIVTVNSDDPTMFNTSVTQECRALVQQLGFTVGELRHLCLNAIEASFMSEWDKQSMRSTFDREWKDLLDKHF